MLALMSDALELHPSPDSRTTRAHQGVYEVTHPNRKTIIAGNWKMHKTRAGARELTESIVRNVDREKDLPEIVLCPPFTSLHEVETAVRGSDIKVGAQNMDYRASGAFTGEIAPTMLTDLGVKYVLIGHSERRQFFGETNALVNLKLKAALEHALIPVVCVGESLDERETGLTDAVLRRQVGAALADLTEEQIKDLVVAYEPVWAIGTGKVCQAQEANRVAALIRATINDLYAGKAENKTQGKGGIGDGISILYGGSVKPSNIDEQLQQSEIDGALVGGASLTAQEFLPLIRAAQERVKLACSRA